METNSNSLNCPTCGAPLEIDGKNPFIRCTFCRNMIVIDAFKKGDSPEGAPEKARKIPEEILEAIKSGNQVEAIKSYRLNYDVSLARAKYAIERIQGGNLIDPENGFPAAVSSSIKFLPDQTGKYFGNKKRNSLIGIMIPIIILLVVGILLTFLFIQPGSPFVPNLLAMDPSILLENNQGEKTKILSQFYNIDSEQRLIGLVDPEKPKLVWMSDNLPKDTYVDSLLIKGELVFYASEDQLFAVHESDGSPAWQVQMPDRLNYGKDSMVVIDDRLLVLTLDRSLNAYDTITGNLAWKRVLYGYDHEIRVMGEGVVILDYPEGSTNFSLFILNPVDGSLLNEISPVCRFGESMEDGIAPDSGLIYDEETKSLYLIYGSFNGCIQRYDLESCQLDWQYFQEDAFSFSMQGFFPILTKSTLFFSDEHRLEAVNKKNGAARIIHEAPDYELVPLMVSDDNILVRARRTRGSERFELWGLNITSGGRLWDLVLDDSFPIDPPNEMNGLIDSGDHAWTWHPVNGGFLLLDFQADPNQLVIKNISIANGSITNEIVIPFKSISGDFYSVPEIIGWKENLLYLNLDSDLYIVDTSSGEILSKFQ